MRSRHKKKIYLIFVELQNARFNINIIILLLFAFGDFFSNSEQQNQTNYHLKCKKNYCLLLSFFLLMLIGKRFWINCIRFEAIKLVNSLCSHNRYLCPRGLLSLRRFCSYLHQWMVSNCRGRVKNIRRLQTAGFIV